MGVPTTPTMFLPLLLALGVAAQSEREPATERDPAIEDAIAQIEDAVQDRRMARDDEVVRGLRQLRAAAQRDDLHEDDREAILETATAVLARGPLRPPERSQLYRAAAAVLSELEAEGAKMLRRVYESSRFPHKPRWVEMRAALVRAVGETEDLRSVDFLLERATRSDEPKVLAAAGEALGHFAGAGVRVRKEIVGEMATKLAGVEGEARQPVINRPGERQNFGPQNAARRLAAMRRPWNATLRRLTGAEVNGGAEWQRWWNKNKNRPWR